MYVYCITNNINGKQYIGITNNYKRRWQNHRCNNDPSMAIAKAIKKYGVNNFKFEVIEEGLSIEQASKREIELIKEMNTLVPNGYNVAKGGMYNIGTVKDGSDNSNAKLTEDEARYIREHRDQPMYILYEQFNHKLSYEAFKKVYNGLTYKNIMAKEVTPYPYNAEFSNQFTSSILSYEEVIELRKQYDDGIYWKEAFKPFKDRFKNEWSFWNIYNGNSYKLVMPEVFTEENKHKHSSLKSSGENNGRAKLTKEDVVNIRRLYETKEKTRKELQEMYSQVSTSAINNIISYRTWKNL